MKVLIAISLLALVNVAPSMCSVSAKFKEFEIIPDILNVAPSKLIEITYPSGASVNLGNELTPTEVKDKPTLKWDHDEDSFYTVILSDPDAPSRANPTIREVRHWYVVNIPGTDVVKGETLFDYIGSGPPKDTGLHRYVFVVYKQPGKLEFDEPRVSNRSRTQRWNSSTLTFAEKYGLGDPIAGNFYQAQYDDYVPILHAQLSSGNRD
ncbi:protein D3-like [Bradysia coprophila]|uniref:protein D3-like n=1 Tax=Bradysia coprophila TaxID=38358 RepID=UPI00187DA459|nr:protein D3-like [Bradysia coprophila]